MGSSSSRYFLDHLWKEDEPNAYEPIKYHPEFGFEDRQKKVMKAPKEEMDSVGLPDHRRDLCSHIRVQYKGCIKDRAIFFFKCKGLYDEMHDCYYQETIADMMEYEREKRLNRRERRLRMQME